MNRMEINMLGRTETDRKMWFSMWFLASIATFGLAFFPMFYRSIERRNKHFHRQYELEKQVATFFKNEGEEWQPNVSPERHAKLWAASIILIIPVFAIAYFLSKDLLLHEKRQLEFLQNFFPEINYMPQSISIRNCALITGATLGFGVVYWLYKILNVYNNHFKEQQHIENEILRLMEAKSHVESV
jgi:hypothetical protein